jgi:FkbM family methyltransferase
MDLQVLNEMYNENVYRVDKSLLNGDRVVLEIGAHIGSFSIQMASLGASKVYAIEPNPSNIEVLQSNIEANSYENLIEVIPYAVWNSEKDIYFGDFDSDSRSNIANELESEVSKELIEYDGGKQFKSAAMTLTQIFSDYEIGEVDIMKVDAEWSEYFIFEDVSDEIMNNIKYITMEFHGVDSGPFGKLIEKLTRTHIVETLGSYERGGFIYARRY